MTLPYLQLNVDEISISSDTVQRLGRLRQCPSVPLKMTAFTIDCTKARVHVMPEDRAISNDFDLQFTYSSPIDSEVVRSLPLQRLNSDQRAETVLDQSSEIEISLSENGFKDLEDGKVELTLTQNILCELMKMLNLNMSYSDHSKLFDFSWEKGVYDGETGHMCYM